MSERLALHDIHARLDARFTESDGWLLPCGYGDPAAEHEAVRERAGVIDRSERGKLELTGKDRVTFLHGLVTNDVKGLSPGQGNESALLDVQGKLTALLAVHCLPDRLVVETDRRLAEPVRAQIDHYLFAERVELEDVSDLSGILTVAGPLARKALETALGPALPDLVAWQHVWLEWEGLTLRVVRTRETGEEGYDVWVTAPGLAQVWDRLRDAGVAPVGREAWNVLRMEAGMVRYGVDADASTLLLEAPLAE